MEWKIAWRDRQSPYPVQKETLNSEADLKQRVAMLIDKEARDISISQIPPQRDLGGIPYADIVTSLRIAPLFLFLEQGFHCVGDHPEVNGSMLPSQTFFPAAPSWRTT
jgi:hypothetical protein